MVKNKKIGARKPVSVGDVFDVKIDSLGKQGDGVAVVGDFGFVVMVQGAKLNKEYKIEITRVLPTMAFGRILINANDKRLGKNLEVVDSRHTEEVEI